MGRLFYNAEEDGAQPLGTIMITKSMKIAQQLRRRSIWFVHIGVFCLVILGIMNIVHNLSFRTPEDGAIWAMQDDKLTVTDVTWGEETELEIGDQLKYINDKAIQSETERLDYLYSLGIDNKRPLLYRVENSGHDYSYWIYIRGERQAGDQEFYLYALTGFVYLIFLLLLLLQDIKVRGIRSLSFFSFCVFLHFVFRPTDAFTTLDWISLFLDRFGNLLLPSAIAMTVIGMAMGDSRWKGYAQAIHWAPTGILCGWNLWLFARAGGLNKDQTSILFQDVADMQQLWAGILIATSVLVVGVVAEIRSKGKNLTVFWAIAWLPLALGFLGLDFELIGLDSRSSRVLTGGLPMILPIAFLFDWSREGRLYLGSLTKKVVVYFTVVVLLLAGYGMFIALFQTLLAATVSRNAHIAILGMAIMFAAVTYTPLSHFFADLLDRLHYGKRYQPIREFGDLTKVNRADINIDDFLFSILNRIKRSFRVVGGSAYKVGENLKSFKTIVPIEETVTFLFEDLPGALLEGDLVRGNEVNAVILDEEGRQRSPFLPNDYLLPIRVSSNLGALIVFTPQGGDLKLAPEEERMLKAVLRQCDVLMENMELYQDINQKANSLNQLKEYNENIIESSRIGILTTDEMGKAVSCNQAFQEIAGIPKELIMGQSFNALFVSKKGINQRQTRSGFLSEGAFRNQNREDLLLEIQHTPLRTKENEVYGTLYFVEDVREKKQFSEQIMQQEKLASIGLLAAGVAHEINTPLTGIASYSQFLMGDSNIKAEQKELLELIQGQSMRAAKIVNELLNFSRKNNAPKGPMDLLEVLNQTLRFLGHQIQKRKVRVTVQEPREEPVVVGYDNQVQQVFVNLIVNAMDAMPNGGDLRVDFGTRPGQIMMAFRDSGVGMDAKTKSSIFDPFYTTKEVGKGTGLGLSVVYNILQAHGATVEVDSRPGEGTDFCLFFPKAPAGTQSEPAKAAYPDGFMQN